MKNLDPIFWPCDEVNTSIRAQMQRDEQDSIINLQIQWSEADLDQRCYLGDPDVWNVLFPFGSNYNKRMFSFNITHATIQMITGHQRRNRKSTICVPVQSPVQKTADQFTKCLFYVHSKGAYQVYSDAFEQGAVVQGFGLISIFPDYSSDPVSPEIRIRYIDFKSVLIDPYFRQKDLSDCRFIRIRQYFTLEDAMIFYSEHAEKIREIKPISTGISDIFFYMPENVGLNTQNMIAFDEYWSLTTREATFIVDTKTEETKEIFGDEEDLRVVLLELGDQVRIVKKNVKTVQRIILVNNVVMVQHRTFDSVHL